MGQPKLLLPLGGKTVLACLLEVLDHPAIATRAVVLRRADIQLLKEVQSAGAWAIQPEIDPPQMRESVECGLTAIRERFAPATTDGWMLVPADHPVLSTSVIDQVISAWQTSAADIVVPSWEGRRGHPTIFSWELAERVAEIPPDQGLNWLLKSAGARIEEIPVNDPAIFTDLDTPEDYAALLKTFPAES